MDNKNGGAEGGGAKAKEESDKGDPPAGAAGAAAAAGRDPEEIEDSDCSTSSYESNSSPSEASEDEVDLIPDPERFARSLLNFRSANFNAALALKCNKNDPYLKIPNRNAPRYLNLAHYSKAVTNPAVLPDGITKNTRCSVPLVYKAGKVIPAGSRRTLLPKPVAVDPQFPIPGRRFLHDQLPVFNPVKPPPNTITRMENMKGPLSGLTKAMEEQRKVKVWTRNDVGIRGFVTGFVEAFDKHWNLALRDADEQFLRRKNIKYPTEINSHVGIPNINDDTKDEKKDGRRRSPRKKRTNSADRKSSHSGTRRSSRGHESGKNEESTPPLVLQTSSDLMSICRKGLSELNLDNKSKRVARSRSESKGSVDRSLSKHRASSSSRKNSSITKSAVRKHRLVIFKRPQLDANGFKVVAQTKKYEIVERHVGQLFLMGNDVVFIETMI